MIIISIKCARCSKEFSQDITNTSLSNDLIRKFGFGYTHNGKTNVVLCNDCEKQYNDLQERLEVAVKSEMCDFFDYCEGDENGNTGGTEDD